MKQAEERTAMTRQELKKINVTKMLLTVVVIFVICWLIPMINIYINFHIIPYAENTFITIYFTTFNSSVNCIIYGIYRKTFRESFFNLLKSCIGCKNVNQKIENIQISILSSASVNTVNTSIR